MAAAIVAPPAAGTPRRRRWLSARGRSLEITKSGWLFIGLSLLVGFAAINSGSNLLHAIFGAMLSLIIASGMLSEATVRRVAARRQVVGAIHAGTAAPLRVQVRSTDRGDALAVSVEDDERNAEGAGHCDPAFAVRVPGGGSIELHTNVVMPRRGPAQLPRAVVATRFPFGLFIKRRALPAVDDVVVYPRLVPVGADALGLPAGGDDDGRAKRSRAGEFFGLREFREGDDPRRIHWPAVARLNRPVVREMETGGRPEQVVTVPPGAAGEPSFESDVEHCASVAMALLDRGVRVAVHDETGERIPPGFGADHRRAILEVLARAGFAQTTPAGGSP